MSLLNELVEFVKTEFSFLKSTYKFTGPKVEERYGYSARIFYIGDVLSVEISLDVREKDISILLVRMKDKKLPKGYYMDRGEKVRIYLIPTITSNGWKKDDLIRQLKHISQQRSLSIDYYKQDLIIERDILLSNMDNILLKGVELFK